MWILYLSMLAIGIYIVSSIIENRDQNKRYKKFMRDMENFDNKTK